MDVVTLHQAGFDNAVASMGTALTVEQTRLLSRYTRELVLCYDNDGAGQQATERALQLLNNSEFTVKVLKLPNRMVDGQPKKQDADDFIKNHGAAAFENLLNGSGSGIEFRMAQIASQFDLTDDRGKVEYTAAITPVLAALSGAVERDVYAVRAAEAAGISPEAYFKMPQIPAYAENNAHMFYIVCNSLEERTALIKHLKERDILAVSHYLSLHKSEFYKDSHWGGELPNCDRFADTLLRLPLYYELSNENIYYICECIYKFFKP